MAKNRNRYPQTGATQVSNNSNPTEQLDETVDQPGEEQGQSDDNQNAETGNGGVNATAEQQPSDSPTTERGSEAPVHQIDEAAFKQPVTEPTNTASPVVDTPVAATVVETKAEPVLQPATDLNTWAGLRDTALARLPSQTIRLLVWQLESFQAEFGQNANYADESRREAGAARTAQFYREVCRLFNAMTKPEAELGWRLMVGFVKFHSKRYDSMHPGFVFRFQPSWVDGEEAQRFELLITLLHTTVEADYAGCRQLDLVRILGAFRDNARNAILSLYNV